MGIQEYDDVILKDGRTAGIVEIFDSTHFLADVGDGPTTWATIEVTLAEIERVDNRPNDPNFTA